MIIHNVTELARLLDLDALLLAIKSNDAEQYNLESFFSISMTMSFNVNDRN